MNYANSPLPPPTTIAQVETEVLWELISLTQFTEVVIGNFLEMAVQLRF